MRLRISGTVGAALTLAALAGCAGEGPPPKEEMARAHTLVSQADKAGAQRYAAADLQRAHDELARATTEFDAKKYDAARADAEKAAVDADLASARQSAGESRQAANQLARDQSALSQEAQRATDAASQPPPPPPPPEPTPQ
ncbi:MAG TPA: DUF4398 domain-containing protein [Steroidobacteraceae bacterium]|nr:DUF4398 domain-containing protein [Steroidobacteraceae bacterium]